ncbi:MAG: DNA-binding response regulator, partial [Deltaproteobacteria bacterium]
MLLETLGPRWQDLHQQVKASVRVLVASAERDAVAFLRDASRVLGIRLEVAPSLSEAQSRIVAGWDLVVVDRTLRRGRRHSLVERVAATRPGPQALLLGDSLSLEATGEALQAGAVEHLPRPLEDLDHAVARLAALLDPGVLRRLHERLLREVMAALRRAGLPPMEGPLARRLFALRRVLAQRPSVAYLDADTEGVRRLLGGSGTVVTGIDSLEAALAWGRRPGAPLTVVLGAAHPEALTWVRRLREESPLFEILVCSEAADLDLALAAIQAGATDYVAWDVEGAAFLRARLERAAARARARRLFAHLIRLLAALARRYGVEETWLLEALPRPLRPVPAPVSSDPSSQVAVAADGVEVEVDDLLPVPTSDVPPATEKGSSRRGVGMAPAAG